MRLVLALLVVLIAGPLHAANVDRSRQVVTMVYDLGLYGTELDRIMALADSRGLYAGGTPAARAHNRMMTRDLMLKQRDAVLNETIGKVAARATDPQLNEILRMAATPDASIDHALIDQAVTAVKSSFEESMWDQLARTARGLSEFPCTKDQPSRCT
ncbi:hypothetical protein [Acidisphaera sp. L21]|jgi:hypothetical protein|uniref:hypothetical protein n=1 Tax=Acidisphaera sp. L21 TaxID=1641851 RepID=UPI00131BB416|nr:hypothetical protein [Acidisphaera sp. L21]